MNYYLLYVSYATKEWSMEDLTDLLKQANSYNLIHDLTGMLIYSNRQFIQLLEGEKEEIITLYKKIEQHPGHKNISIVLEGKHDSRVFPNWSMGFKNLSTSEFKQMTGFSDPDAFFKQHLVSDQDPTSMIFLKLFYEKNYRDFKKDFLYS